VGLQMIPLVGAGTPGGPKRSEGRQRKGELYTCSQHWVSLKEKNTYFTGKTVELARFWNRCGPPSEQTCYSNYLDEFSAGVLKVFYRKTARIEKEHV